MAREYRLREVAMNSDDDQFSVSSDSSKTRSTKGSFRRRLKSIGSSADRSRHSIIDGTRTVGSRVKKVLARRTSKEIVGIKEEAKEEGTSAAPGAVACEIFDSIKFDFPASPSLTSASCAGDDPNSSSDETLPPPQFPPPPLPDQFSDDLFSDRSSASYSDSPYELLGRNKAASSSEGGGDGVDTPFCMFGGDNFDVRSDTLSNSLGNESEELRSRSSGDDFIDSFNRVFANFDMKPMNVTERAFEFSSSETGSSGNSVERAYHRASYENWDLRAVQKVTHVRRPPSPSKSVILQFDPLYDAVCPDEAPAETYDEEDVLSGIFANVGASHPQSFPEPSELADERIGAASTVVVGEEREKRDSNKSSPSSVSGWSLKGAFKAVAVNRWGGSAATKTCVGPTLKTNGDSLCKPELCSKFSGMLHNGYLFKSASSASERTYFTRLWCQLAEGKLFYSVEKDAPSKETFDLESILSIHQIKDVKTG